MPSMSPSGASRASRTGLQSAVLLAAAALGFAWTWWQTVVHTPLLALPPERLPAKNAYDVYKKALANVPDTNEIVAVTAQRGRNSVFPTARRTALLSRYHSALALIREGLRLDYVQPVGEDLYQEYGASRFASLARLLALDAGERLDAQDWEGAMTAQLDQIEFWQLLIRGAGISAIETAAEFRTYAFFSQQEPLERLTAAQLRRAIARLEDIVRRRPSFSDVLVDEKWQQLRIRDHTFSDHKWRTQLMSGGGYIPVRRGGRMVQQSPWLEIDKRGTLLAYNRYMDACIALENHSNGATPAFARPPSDPVNTALAADIGAARQIYTAASSEDLDRLLRMALRLYRLEHGAYPENLAALSPDYIRQTPPASYIGTAPRIYRRTAASYTLVTPSVARPRPRH